MDTGRTPLNRKACKTCRLLLYTDKYKKKLNSLKQCLTATPPTSYNYNSKNQKGALTFAARRHNVNVLLRNSTFMIFAVLVL